MNAILWLVTVALGYAALTLWLSQIMRAFRTRRTPLAVALLVLPLVLCLLAPLARALEIHVAIILFAIGFAVVSSVLYLLLGPGRSEPILPPRERIPAVLQLILVTGSAIFLIPFAWLVITSVKSDDQMASYPPQIVPRQQVMVNIDGHQRGLVRLPYKGHVVLGADLRDNPNGTLLVKVLGAHDPNAVVTVALGDAKKVEHFSPRWQNYSDALHFLPRSSYYGLLYVVNTLIIAVLSVIGTVLSCSLVAYAFARLNWPGRDIVFGIVLATMMIPAAVTMMPNFLIFRALHWVDTLLPLWVPSFFGAAFS